MTYDEKSTKTNDAQDKPNVYIPSLTKITRFSNKNLIANSDIDIIGILKVFFTVTFFSLLKTNSLDFKNLNSQSDQLVSNFFCNLFKIHARAYKGYLFSKFARTIADAGHDTVVFTHTGDLIFTPLESELQQLGLTSIHTHHGFVNSIEFTAISNEVVYLSNLCRPLPQTRLQQNSFRYEFELEKFDPNNFRGAEISLFTNLLHPSSFIPRTQQAKAESEILEQLTRNNPKKVYVRQHPRAPEVTKTFPSKVSTSDNLAQSIHFLPELNFDDFSMLSDINITLRSGVIFDLLKKRRTVVLMLGIAPIYKNCSFCDLSGFFKIKLCKEHSF